VEPPDVEAGNRDKLIAAYPEMRESIAPFTD